MLLGRARLVEMFLYVYGRETCVGDVEGVPAAE